MKKITKKIFQSRTSISNWLIVLLVYVMFIQFSMILDLGNTVKEQRFMRICPEPYVCVVPPENWKGRIPMGLTHYKRIPV
tara:strand:- start:951 stop:1190 length:240 start_codon:yes stop_codon:yes gene_type:complete